MRHYTRASSATSERNNWAGSGKMRARDRAGYGVLLGDGNKCKTPKNPMNSLHPHSIAGRSFGLVFSLVLAGSAYAGPGPQYWQSRGTASAQPAISATVPAIGCPASRSIAVTTLVPSQANGRGALHAVAVGTERVCTMCGNTATVVKPSWQNGRGPLQPATVYATHECVTSCCMSVSKA